MVSGLVLKILHTFYEGKLNKEQTIFTNYGIFKLIIQCIVLLIQPIYKAGDTRLTFMKEQYFDSNTGTFPTFTRDVNGYLIFIGIVIHFMIFMVSFVSFTTYQSTRSYRICKTYKVSNLDTMYVVKSYLNDNPLTITFFLLITTSIFFTMIVSITENGYLRDINTQTFADAAAKTNEINSRSVFYNFNTIYWNVFITFTTIGNHLDIKNSGTL